jgi:hypothetical protein
VSHAQLLCVQGVFVVERPGLPEFLHQLAAFAEVIIYTAGEWVPAPVDCSISDTPASTASCIWSLLANASTMMAGVPHQLGALLTGVLHHIADLQGLRTTPSPSLTRLTPRAPCLLPASTVRAPSGPSTTSASR